MALALFISAIIAGLIFKKSKICTIYMFAIMYIFAAYRTYDADYNTYLIGYNNLGNASAYRYAGYSLFVRFFYNLGFDFETYNHLFFLIVLVLLIIAIRLLTKNINVVLACYLVYSYSLDVIQMKSAIADVLALLSIAIIININSNAIESEKRRKLMWCVGILCLGIAVYMHFSTLYYVIALVIYNLNRNRKNIGLRVIIISGVLTGLLYSGLLLLIMRYANVLRILGDLDYMSHWAQKSTRYGYLIYILIITLLIVSCRYNQNEMIKNDRQREVSNFIFTALLIIPFVFLNGQYSRLIRDYMILTYVIFAEQERSVVITGKRIVNNLMCIGAISLLFYLDIASNYENVLGALLRFNSLVGIMR